MPVDAQFLDVAALAATVLAAVAALPQLRRLVVADDGRGVSLTGAVLGVVNEAVWVTYALHEALWSAVPEAVLMAAANAVVVVALLRLGAGARGRAWRTAAAWAGVLAVVAAIGGAGALGVALGAASAVQVAPAVWTAWRTASPSGVAGATWAMILVEAGLWGIYGVGHGDPATTVLAIVGSAAGVAMLTRKAVVRHHRHRDTTMHRPSERPGAWAVSPLTGTG